MKRAIYDVPRWSVYLNHRERRVGRAQDTDDLYLKFEDELFERIYGYKLPEKEVEIVEHDENEAPKPAEKQVVIDAPILSAGPETDKLQALHARAKHAFIKEAMHICHGDATEAALAAAWISQIVQHMADDSPPTDVERSENSEKKQEVEEEQAKGLDDLELGDETQPTGEDDPQMRDPNTPEGIRRKDQVAEVLKDDERLRRIALLAAKFKRIMLAKQKMRVHHDADEVADVEIGGEISRLIPSELLKFAIEEWEFPALRDLAERKMLQYSVRTLKRPERGPIVFCLDKTHEVSGARDEWITAVMLAAFEMARRQDRHFIYLGYDDDCFAKMGWAPHKKIEKKWLEVAPRHEGRDLEYVLDLALRAAESRKIMNRCDVLLVAAGGATSGEGIGTLHERAAQLDVTISGVTMGDLEDFEEWCDWSATQGPDLQTIDDHAATVLFSR